MIRNKTISVWLKLQDGPNAEKFVLQKRSLSNKTFPHICQATWAGKVEMDESIDSAIKRECEEELGKNFAENFSFSDLKLISTELFGMKGGEWESHNFLGKIDENLIKFAKLHTEAEPKFIFVDKNSEIYSLSSGKDAKNNIVLFNDQYKVFKKL